MSADPWDFTDEIVQNGPAFLEWGVWTCDSGMLVGRYATKERADQYRRLHDVLRPDRGPHEVDRLMANIG